MKLKWWGRCLLLIALLSAHVQAQKNPLSERVVVQWYVGLGTGTAANQIEVEQRVADEFNNSQTEIYLEFVCGCGGSTAQELLQTMIAAEVAPDIVGPVGLNGANSFAGEWLDLQPLIDKTGYDLSQFSPNLIEMYRSSEGLLSLPFAIFPGVLYYNVDLFDAAGLNYPPTVPGEPYIMPDGREVPWDYDTVTTLAQLLTIDVNGHPANSADFDSDEIVQYGFVHQWDNLRSDFHTFGAASPVDENGQVMIPDNWRAQARWMWDGVWKYHFMPPFDADDPYYYPFPFAEGHVAMARSMLWYTCCIQDLEARWDLAIQPAYQGQIYAPMDADSFYILKDTDHPEEAFIALQYLMRAPDLMAIYGGFPARPDLQAEALALKASEFPEDKHWDVVLASIPLAPTPHQEQWYPNSRSGQELFAEFLLNLRSQEGKTMDLDVALNQLEADLQMIVNTDPKDCDRLEPRCGK